MSEQEAWEIQEASTRGLYNVVVMFDDPVSGRRLEKRRVTSSYLTKADAELIVRLHEELLEMLNQYGDDDGREVGWRKRLHDSARDAIAKAQS